MINKWRNIANADASTQVHCMLQWSRRILSFELPGRRPRGRPKTRFRDVVKVDMKVVGVREEDAEDRVRWRSMIRCGDP